MVATLLDLQGTDWSQGSRHLLLYVFLMSNLLSIDPIMLVPALLDLPDGDGC